MGRLPPSRPTSRTQTRAERDGVAAANREWGRRPPAGSEVMEPRLEARKGRSLSSERRRRWRRRQGRAAASAATDAGGGGETASTGEGGPRLPAHPSPLASTAEATPHPPRSRVRSKAKSERQLVKRREAHPQAGKG
jgi:hypothetical protein